MFKLKRGQAAASASVLLAIIVGLMIMFIILIPPQERADLLDDDTDNNRRVYDDDIDDLKSIENLLTENPGKIDYLAQKEIEHPLSVINIYTRTEGKVLAEKNLAYAKKGIFSEETTVFKFPISDLDNTNKVLLSFEVQEIQGNLKIALNGEEIFNANVENGVAPIALPRTNLQKTNELTFGVSSPGIAFWATNEGVIEKIKVVGDVKNVEAQTSKNVFLVSETERRNLERVTLKFQPNCEYGEVGKLSVYINKNELYNAVPDCDIALVPIEFSPELLNQGENEILFKTERGTYVLSHVVIESQLKEVDFPIFYFELSKEEFEKIKDEKRRVRLTMDFVDVITRKTGDLIFNGHLYRFDTKEVSETVDLSEDVVLGNNALKIKPKRTVELRELKVDFVR
jgi:hypothetical protein